MSAAEQPNPTGKPYRSAAALYLAAGWQGVLPVRGKWPPPSGYTGYEGRWPTADDLATWERRQGHLNIALRLPEGIIGLDVDMYKADHAEAWEAFTATLPPLPPTTMSTSRSDGSGIRLYRVPSGAKFRGAFTWGEVIQHHHRYVMAWPSIHPDNGGTYRWLTTDGELLEEVPSVDTTPSLPDAWIVALQTEPTPEEDAQDRDRGRLQLNGHRPTGGWHPKVTEAAELAIGRMVKGSRHDTIVKAAARFARHEELELDGAVDAWEKVRAVFLAAVNGERNGEEEADQAWKDAHEFVAKSPSQVPKKAERIAEYRQKEQDLQTSVFGQHTRTGPAPDDGGERRQLLGYTDLGNARRLVNAYGNDLRYAPQLDCWYAWNGKAWSEDLTGDVHRRAKAVVDAMMTEIATLESSDDRKDLAKHWNRSQSAGALRAMVSVAETEPTIPITIDALDANPYLLNVANGTIDLETGAFGPHQRDHLMTKVAPVEYQPDATCPTWEWFVRWAMGDDEQMISFVQRAVGYSLTGETSEQVLFFLNGGGENGKSTFLNVIQHILGDYAISAEPELLLGADNEKHPTGMADIVGRRFIVAQELDEGRRLAEATVKRLTGGERVRARRMHQDFFEFDVHGKFWIAANHRPNIRGTDHAIWRRMRLIPFTATIAPGQKDPTLPVKLRAEAAGILNWALEGLRLWRAEGLGESAAITQATNSYRADQDDVGRFVEECCIVHPDAYCSARELRITYEKWCEENGERPISSKKVGARLTERGYARERRGKGKVWTWIGLGLPTEWGPFEATPSPTPSRPDSDPIADVSAQDETPAQDALFEQGGPIDPIDSDMWGSGENTKNEKTCGKGVQWGLGAAMGSPQVECDPIAAREANPAATTQRDRDWV